MAQQRELVWHQPNDDGDGDGYGDDDEDDDDEDDTHRQQEKDEWLWQSDSSTGNSNHDMTWVYDMKLMTILLEIDTKPWKEPIQNLFPLRL